MKTTLLKHRVLLLLVIAIVTVGVARFALPAYSGQVTSTAIQKLTVYSGVLTIQPSTGDRLELGNAGRDIASTGDIFVRPNRSTAGSRFFNEVAGRCSISTSTSCFADRDCPSSQFCVGSQSLELTGDLTVATGKNLCFPGNDCRVDWPAASGSALWAVSASTLSPVTHTPPYLVHVGDSIGQCSIDGLSCRSDFECDDQIGFQECIPTGGIAGKHGVAVTSNNSQPTLLAYGTSTFGQRDQNNNALNNGNVYVTGNVIVQNRGLLKKRTTFGDARVWYRDVYYNDAADQRGAGLDADTIDGTAAVNFTSAASKDLFWLSYYFPSFSPFYPGLYYDVPTGNKVYTVMCVHTERSRICETGPNAGASCTANGECGLDPYSDPVNQQVSCVKVCSVQQKTCNLDNIYHCRYEKNKVCHANSDCDPAAAPSGGQCFSSTNPGTGSKTFCTFGGGQCPVGEVCRLWSLNLCQRDEQYADETIPRARCTTYPDTGATGALCNYDSDCTASGGLRQMCSGFRCSQDRARKCMRDQDCPNVGNGEYCLMGDVYNNTWCTGVGGGNIKCQEECRLLEKPSCNGGSADPECNLHASAIGYNKGFCIFQGPLTGQCRCSTNMNSVDQLPYLDVNNQPGGGEICSYKNCIGCDQSQPPPDGS